jgi:uncharacterized membrane protein YphA (DoxX/SURF4 family)
MESPKNLEVLKVLGNPWLTWVCALILGCVFIYSSYHKIADPPDFAKSIHNYYIVPGELVNLAAIYMPWFELLAGVAVAIGVGRRGGALGLGLLTVVFIAVLAFNLHRGHPTICGCFGKFSDGLEWTDEIKFAKMWREILLDVGLILLSAQVLLSSVLSGRKPALEEA